MKRPPFIIGLDVDDVLGDLLTPWLAWGNQTFGTNYAEFTGWEAPLQWWGNDCFKFLTASNYNDDIVKPFDGALAAVNALRERGHDIRFVTSTHPGTESAKFAWLVRNRFTNDSDEFIPGKDKSRAPCHVLVDDGYHNVTAFNGWAVLVTRPHNRHEQWPHRINHIAELLNLL